MLVGLAASILYGIWFFMMFVIGLLIVIIFSTNHLDHKITPKQEQKMIVAFVVMLIVTVLFNKFM